MSPEQDTERSVLAAKDREELHTIAGAMGVKAATRMRKADLIEAILAATDGNPANGESEAPEPKPRRVRSVRASELEQDSIAALAEEENALAATSDADEDVMPRARTSRPSTRSTRCRSAGPPR